MVGLSITPTNFKFRLNGQHPPEVEFERVMQVAYAPTKVPGFKRWFILSAGPGTKLGSALAMVPALRSSI